MATKKGKKTQKKRRRAGLWVFLAITALLAATLGYAGLNANTLHVMKAEVYIEDLPAAFEGKKLLYIADIDLCGGNTAKKSGEAVMRLQGLQADMLVLGGDYTSTSLLELLNRTSDGDTSDARRRERSDFFLYIRDFSAPLGKYAIAAPDDFDLPDLEKAMNGGSIRLLSDAMVSIELNGQRLWLAGLTSTGSAARSERVAIHRSDCVIGAAASPALFPAMTTIEATDGGHFYDLALAGHTHGGQIRMFGRSVLSLTSQEQQYLYGWTRETGVPMLTTSGMGCEGANLRIGSQAEAWLITLTAANSSVDEPE